MKERPILFSGEMVRALLEGRKTQTRRVVKPTKDRNGSGCELAPCEIAGEINNGDYHLCPYGQPGDRLWVRENFLQLMHGPVTDGEIKYRADLHPSETGSQPNDGWWWKSRPSIHMPRWASRILLEIISARVERLQEISEADAKAEGAFFTDYGRQCFHKGAPRDAVKCPAPDDHHPQREGWSMASTESHEQCLSSARMAFANLWEKINGPDSWDANPWVWVVEFKWVESGSAAA